MRRRSSLFPVLVLFLSLLACNFSPPPEATPTTMDVPATLSSLQSTQTALAGQPAQPPAETLPPPIVTEPPQSTQPVVPPTIQPLPPTTPPEQFGSLSGKLMYPSEMIPPLRVVVFDINGGVYFFTDTQQNQNTFRIDNLPAGAYQVVAYLLTPAPGGDLAGGYSQAVPCGLAVDCSDHSLIVVQVQPGQETTGVDPVDWYAPPGTFPTNPTK